VRLAGQCFAGTAYPGSASKLAAQFDLEGAVKRGRALICLVAVLLAACSAAHRSHPALRTAVTGRLVVEGGPSGLPAIRPIRGIVRFIGGHHLPVTVSTDAAGVFSVQLPPGRYQVSDRSPQMLEGSGIGTSHEVWSAPVPVTVKAHHITAITLTWFVP
jgi:hypothetical protein